MNELKIIKDLYSKNKNVQKQDDCFLFDKKYLITTDTISESTHFKHEWSSPKDIAIKLIEVNVSDIAASGGIPKIAFLNLGLSRISGSNSWLSAFSKEFKKNLIKYNIHLEGGDTYKSTHTNLTLTLIGETKNPILRNSGKVGNYLYMTGSIGLSNIGINALRGNTDIPLHIGKIAIDRHLRPKANLNASMELIKNFQITAMMDITDGLIQDSTKLALASGLKLEIEIERIPRLNELKKFIGIDGIISSGEELELLFLSTNKSIRLLSTPVTCIGQAKKGKSGVTFTLNGKNYKPQKKGYLHFE